MSNDSETIVLRGIDTRPFERLVDFDELCDFVVLGGPSPLTQALTLTGFHFEFFLLTTHFAGRTVRAFDAAGRAAIGYPCRRELRPEHDLLSPPAVLEQLNISAR